MALVLLREGVRLRNIKLLNKLKNIHPDLKTTALYQQLCIKHALKKSKKIKRWINVTCEKNNYITQVTERSLPAYMFVDQFPTTGILSDPKRSFTAHGWRWIRFFQNDTVLVYKRDKMTDDSFNAHHGCEAHDDDETCIVCEPRACEKEVVLPSMFTPNNTRSVRQWVRCHRVRHNLLIEYLYCFKFKTISDSNARGTWDDIADSNGPVKIDGVITKPSILPCYKPYELDADVLLPPRINT
jgi:hypothetical protein